MNDTTYDGMLNNIIAYYGLLVAILLPTIILLIGSMKDSPRIDKQILFKKIIPTKYFGILLGTFILPGLQFLLFNSHFLGNMIVIIVAAMITVAMTTYVFYSITKIIKWISSGENKEAYHGFYRQNLRLEFLEDGAIEERNEKWYQFWSDENAIRYFGNDICKYINAFFRFIRETKGKDWKCIEKSCAALYYDIADLYRIGRKETKINAHDYRALAYQLIDTIPFCLCANLVEYIDDLGDECGAASLWCGVYMSALLIEMENDNNLGNGDWMKAFNGYFLGTKKNKDKALAIIVMIISCYNQKGETKNNIKRRINKIIHASDKKYIIFYRQLYKEMFNFNPDKSRLLNMVEKGALDE